MSVWAKPGTNNWSSDGNVYAMDRTWWSVHQKVGSSCTGAVMTESFVHSAGPSLQGGIINFYHNIDYWLRDPDIYDWMPYIQGNEGALPEEVYVIVDLIHINYDTSIEQRRDNTFQGYKYASTFHRWTLKVSSLSQIYPYYHNANYIWDHVASSEIIDGCPTIGTMVVAPHTLCPMHSSIDYVFPVSCTFYGVVDISSVATGTCHFGDDTIVRNVGTWRNSSTATLDSLPPVDWLYGPAVARTFVYSAKSVIDSYVHRCNVSGSSIELIRTSIVGCRLYGDTIIEDSCINATDGTGMYSTSDDHMTLIHGNKIFIKNCNFIGANPIGYVNQWSGRSAGDIQIVNCQRRFRYFMVDNILAKNLYAYVFLYSCGDFSYVNTNVYDSTISIVTYMGDDKLTLDNCTFPAYMEGHTVTFRPSPTAGGYDLSDEEISTSNAKLNTVQAYESNDFTCYGWLEEFEDDNVDEDDTGIPTGMLDRNLVNTVQENDLHEPILDFYEAPEGLSKLFSDSSLPDAAPNYAKVLSIEINTIEDDPCYFPPI